MAKRVAFCLVENSAGQVLLVQRGYGKRKFKWSLPGGNCDGQESYHRAAARETREETGLKVETVSLIFEGRRHPIKTYFGRIRGGRLKAQRPECLDAKFFDYSGLPPLAFSADRLAIKQWQEMKLAHAQLASIPLTPPCPVCGSNQTRLRRYPHHRPYRCRTCNSVFASPSARTGVPNKTNEKDEAVSNIILDYLLSERARLGLLAPEAHPGLTVAARDTANWFAGEEHFEERISDYLRQSFAEHPRSAGHMWFLQLAYGRHIWPASAGPPEIAKYLIENIGLFEVASTPDLDYLAIGSAHANFDAPTPSGERFGYALVVAYASDGTSMIADRINQRRVTVGAAPLQISMPLRSIARKLIALPSADEAGHSLNQEAEAFGYMAEGWQVRLAYNGSYARIPAGGEIPVWEPQMADIVADQLVKDCPVLLRPDWQDIGIATGVFSHPDLGTAMTEGLPPGLGEDAPRGPSPGPNFQTEFVVGWRIPFGSERPAHFPPPIDLEGNPVAQDDVNAASHSQRRRRWWPFGS